MRSDSFLSGLPLRQRFAWRAQTMLWWLDPLTCRLRGHETVVSVDYAEGFDTVWCRRCGELLRG